MGRLKLLTGPRTAAPAPPPDPDITLSPLTFSANFFDVDVGIDTVLADVTPAPEVGETRAFVPPTTSADDVYLNAGGTQIRRGSGGGWTGAGDIAYDLRRTLAGALNSPLDTTWNVTLYSPGNLVQLGVSDKWSVTKVADSGYPSSGDVPAASVMDNTTARGIFTIRSSWHETITGDTLLCCTAGAAWDSSVLVEALVEGNSANITEQTWQEVIDPRTGLGSPVYGYWFKLLKPAANTGTVYVRWRVTSSNPLIGQFVSLAYPYYPAAAAYDTLLKVAYDGAAHPTANYTGPTAITQALQYKADHTDQTVWIEIQDNPPTFGWDFDEVNPNYNNATTHTKLYGKAGVTVKFGAYANSLATGIDGMWWGENTQWNVAAMGNGSHCMGLNTGQRIKLWGMEIIGGNPVADGALNWSGSGASILFKRRQPAGFYIYPGTSSTEDVTIIAGFSHMQDVPTYGWGYTKLALYCSADGVAGSCFENPKGDVSFCTVSRVGGRQAGLRAYNPAIRITYSGGAAYKAIKKDTTNGNIALGSPFDSLKLSIPLTLTTAGSGYADGLWNGKGATETTPARPRFTLTGGSGEDASAEVLVVGGVVTEVYISKSVTAGTGYEPGDVLTLNQPGVTPSSYATITLGSTFKVFEGADAASAVVTHEFLIESAQSHQALVDRINTWPGWSAVSLSPAHDLDLTFLTYDAQPAAGVPTANNLASAIAKRTWTGTKFDLSVGADIHSNCAVVSDVRRNVSIGFNTFIGYVESSALSFGKASVLNGLLIEYNRWYDTTVDEYPSLSPQQGYWQGDVAHFVFRHNTVAGGRNVAGSGGGFFFGTSFTAQAHFEMSGNLMDSHSWNIGRDDNVKWFNNLLRNLTQAQVNALTVTPSEDGDSEGLSGALLSTVLPNVQAGNFTPLAIAQAGDGSWRGALDGSGNFAGISPPP